MKLKVSKCNFAQKEVKFLGHVISRDGIKPDPDKIERVRNFPQPQDVTEVKCFLGLASYYRRFIKGFAEMAQPLNHLTKKAAREPSYFLWTDDCGKAFNALREVLTTAPVLAYPDITKPFILYTDASGKATGPF